MKASVFIAGASAILASAKPINVRAMETDWVTDYVTVTVIAGQQLQAKPTDVTTTTTTTAKKTKTRKPKPAYTAVWVPAEPETSCTTTTTTTTSSTTSKAAVQYSTVWVKAEDIATTTSTTSTTTTTSEKAEATTTAASSNTDSSDTLSLKGEYSSVMVNYHNLHRANHSVTDVTWDADLASYALVVANTCKFDHDTTVGGGGYGQNIAAWASSAIGSGEENKYGAVSVTDQWYNSEVENWSYYGQGNPPDGMDIDLYGHFTQVVWKKTTTIGCATAYCPDGEMYPNMNAYFTVCNYKSQGNWGGEYGDNVLEPLGHKMVVV